MAPITPRYRRWWCLARSKEEGAPRRATSPQPHIPASALVLSVDDVMVDRLGQVVDLPSDLRVEVQLLLLCNEVMVGLCLLERRLAVLTDHHEGRQEDGLQGNEKVSVGHGDRSRNSIQMANTAAWM